MKNNTYFFSLLLLCFSSRVFPQVVFPVVDSIPMRDGKKLAVDIYIPATCTQCPVILLQTPYNRQLLRYLGLPLIDTAVSTSNYAMAVVDWRGSYGSAAAAYSGSPTRGEDGYDCVEWVYQQSWCNGKIGTWGPSALGRVQFQTAKENPPHLTCMVTLTSGPQHRYLEYFPGGVYRTEYVDQLDALGFGVSTSLLLNPAYNAFWQSTETDNYYPDSIKVPTMMIGGWYDFYTESILPFFNGIRANSPLSVRDKNRLLMGPWVHGGNGPSKVGTAQQGQLSYPNAAEWNDSLALLFFDHHLRNLPNGWEQSPYVQYYQMGENNWKTSPVWPPAGLTDYNFYFHPDSTMDITIPTNSTGSLNFNYDPLDPSPTVGGTTLRFDLVQGPYDQSDTVEGRNDILTFTTPTLTQDMAMVGNAQAHLKVSSDKTDTDFAVRLTDVYPDGRSMLVMDGIRRMRFRNGYTAATAALMTPGQIYSCVIDLPATAITFSAGHSIRVDVTSSDYPRFNRNANSGGSMYPGLNGDSLQNPQTAANTVYMNSINNSYITLPLTSSPPVSIAESENNEADVVMVYPNPTKGKFGVWSSESGEQRIEVKNSIGQVIVYIQTKNSPLRTEIDLSSHPKGVYFLHVQTGDTVVAVKKIIVI